MKHSRILIVLFALLLFSAGSASAATLTFDAPDAVPFGETFTVPIRINPDEECINAIDATVTYSTDALTAVDVSRGESIFTLWVEPPEIESGAGTIAFAGGIPGGYCGTIDGDLGDANVVLTLVFTALENPGEIGETRNASLGYMNEPNILLHDGFGTPADVVANSATITVRELGELPKNEWAEALDADDIFPENFGVSEYVDPLDGISYIVFSTTDKQTGIDYYEVLEVDFDGNAPGTNRQASWQRWEAGQRYELMAQDGTSRVTVRAYDKAGNWRDSVLERRRESESSGFGISKYIIYGGIFLILLAVFLLVVLRVRRRRINSDSL